MLNKVEGFNVEVTVTDALPRVRVSFQSSGEQVLNTDALSIAGMEHMAAVFTRAARMAYGELEAYWDARRRPSPI